MRIYRFHILVVGLAIGGLLLFHPTAQVVRAGTGCAASTIAGTYGVSLNGLVTSSRNVPHIGRFVPVALGGTIGFDGVSTISRTFTLSFGGEIISEQDSGSYTVSSDCTGVIHLTSTGETVNFVIVSGGNEIRFAYATTGIVTAGSMTKL